MQTMMREQEAQGPAAGANSLANRAKEIQQVEERLVRDLQICIDASNKLLKRLGKPTLGDSPGPDGVAASPENT